MTAQSFALEEFCGDLIILNNNCSNIPLNNSLNSHLILFQISHPNQRRQPAKYFTVRKLLVDFWGEIVVESDKMLQSFESTHTLVELLHLEVELVVVSK